MKMIMQEQTMYLPLSFSVLLEALLQLPEEQRRQLQKALANSLSADNEVDIALQEPENEGQEIEVQETLESSPKYANLKWVGAWESELSAEEQAEELRSARTPNTRFIEPF